MERKRQTPPGKSISPPGVLSLKSRRFGLETPRNHHFEEIKFFVSKGISTKMTENDGFLEKSSFFMKKVIKTLRFRG